MSTQNGIAFPSQPIDMSGLLRSQAADEAALADVLATLATARAASQAAQQALATAEARVIEFQTIATEAADRAGERILNGGDMQAQGALIAGATATVEAAKRGVTAALRNVARATAAEHTAAAALYRGQAAQMESRAQAQLDEANRFIEQVRARDGQCHFVIVAQPNTATVGLVAQATYAESAAAQALARAGQ